MQTFNIGAPPATGWHIIDGECEHTMLRYWHGPDRGWSAPCYDDDPEHIRMRAGGTPAESQAGIRWRE